MKKPVVVLFFSVVLALFGKAQSFDWAIQPGGYNFYTSVEGSSAFDGSYVVLADSWGNVYNAGVYSPASVGPTTDFDPGPAYVFPGVPGTNSFIQKFDSAGNMLWLKSFPGFEVFVYDADFDAAGNIVLVGNYNGNMDADPGASTYSLTSAGGLGTFILKIDTAGNLLWATQFETSTFLHSRPYDVEVNAINQVIFAGSFNDTLDVDPGAGVVSLIPNGTGTYVVALDASGNYVWSRQFGGSSSYASVTPSGLDTDPAGNIYLCGDYSKTIDVDPGPGVYTIGVTDTVGNSFVLKLDNTGNLVWADEFLGTGNSFFARLKIDMAGDILVTGGTEGGMDFDPGAGTVTYPALGSMFYDAFFFKLSPSGSLVWSKYFGSSSDDYGSDIEIDAANNYYVSGAYSSSADLDPGPMVNTFTSLGTDLFLQKYNATGNVEWVYALEHTTNGNVSGNAIGATTTNVYLAGFFTRYSSGGTIDFDPDTSTANLTTINVGHGFFTRLQQGPCSALKLFIDSLEQAYCDTDGYVLGHASFGVMPYTYAWSTTPVTPGPAASISASGFYTLSVTDSIGCTVNKTVFVSGPEPGGLDFDVSTIHSSVFALVMPNYFWLDLQNPGCDTASGQLYLIHDAKISVSTCTPVPDTVYGDTLVWNISSFNSDDGSFAPYIVFDVTASAIVGDYTVIKTGINTTGADIDLTNNMEKDSIEILLSYDPNEKSGEPFGECSQHYVLNSQRMQYTVQFQNTGTAAALDVYILDTLDAALDINTFKCIHASHSMITEQLPGNVLKFVFNDIYLPDSTSDEAGSHG
ncbi:MAG TPA: SBBP repeat-containing protein, partial [Flavobacteriales bacterium]|nr:SBBP repeat-containing protein [Flavobacteriales bacterium]